MNAAGRGPPTGLRAGYDGCTGVTAPAAEASMPAPDRLVLETKPVHGGHWTRERSLRLRVRRSTSRE